MELQNLEAFCVVYEEGSISKAAKKLFMSQQGLSKAIIKLEKEFSKPLFTRSNKGVVPTDYARALYPKASRLSAILNSIEDDSSLPEREELHIAATSGFLMSVGLEFINEFERDHSTIELRLEECSDQRVAEQVDSGSAEVGFMAGPIDYEKYRGELFLRLRHVAVISERDTLARKESLTWKDLDDEAIALMSRSHAPYDLILSQMLKEGAAPKRLIETSEGYLGFDLASKNQAICISTDLHASKWARGDVRIIPIYDDYYSWDVSLITCRREKPGNAAQSFIDYALQWIKQHRNERFTWEHTVDCP
ncbi:LysR family transcriptional regulator [Adlercreutzia shanghongiae]|uniref:LysR family transcriptional regulator n=1 Tax=Adlercreutzia shanghongiae TaxID=3111773 RepID=A0ABU6IW40_9ACTN|nr:LysR family transcriptional regulator [Adlercreutzia sp. R22]MEC4293938.1 LysR family transcriptional regulator [Adlercreutzia sp. R22]